MTTKVKNTQINPIPASASNSILTGTPTAPTPSVSDDSTRIATTAYVKDNLDNYLPLSGGTLTGNFYGAPGVQSDAEKVLFICKDPTLTKGDTPTANRHFTLAVACDASGSILNNYKFGQIEAGVFTTNASYMAMHAYKNEANVNTNAGLEVGFRANGDVYTAAPTPATSDNSTQIATTAYVKSNLNSYLPLTGGTISGTLTIGTSGCTLSYNSTNKCLDFIFS